MNEILKGNFKTKNKVSSSESAKDDCLENRFEKEAAFTDKKQILYHARQINQHSYRKFNIFGHG